MTFLIIAIPLMILTVSIAAVPLLVLTAREHRMRRVEVQERGTHVRP
jgi:Mn2+/Fe2+ NRAMP family transporter